MSWFKKFPRGQCRMMHDYSVCSREVLWSWVKEHFCPSCSPQSSVLYFPVFCQCLVWLQFLFVLAEQSRWTFTYIGLNPLEGSPTKFLQWPKTSNFSSGAIGKKDHLYQPNWGLVLFPSPSSCFSSWSLGFAMVQGTGGKEKEWFVTDYILARLALVLAFSQILPITGYGTFGKPLKIL